MRRPRGRDEGGEAVWKGSCEKQIARQGKRRRAPAASSPLLLDRHQPAIDEDICYATAQANSWISSNGHRSSRSTASTEIQRRNVWRHCESRHEEGDSREQGGERPQSSSTVRRTSEVMKLSREQQLEDRGVFSRYCSGEQNKSTNRVGTEGDKGECALMFSLPCSSR